VFTNSELQAMGVGYILRWKVVGRRRSSGSSNSAAWQTPQAGWPPLIPDASVHGIPFWSVYGDYDYRCRGAVGGAEIQMKSTFVEWYNNYNHNTNKLPRPKGRGIRRFT